MSITRTEDVRLPELSRDASEADRRLLQALYDQFRDTNQRLWALESTLGIAPRRAATTIPATSVNSLSLGLGGGSVSSNVAVGGLALGSNTSGSNNSGVGYSALANNTTGVINSGFGSGSLYGVTTGSGNVGVGFQAGYAGYGGGGAVASATGDGNVFVGYGSTPQGAADSNSIVIGGNAVGKGANAAVLGNDDTTDTYLKGAVHFAAELANGQSLNVQSLTELTTIAAAATTDTAIQMPANSIVLAVSVRVTAAVTCTSTFTVGDSTVADRFNTVAVSKAATSTDAGTKAACYYNPTAAAIRITPDTTPSDNTGRVRVTIHYITCAAPTS